ncbi:MAG: hypothetical protein V3U98_03625 [Acidobacteriota bacterium]
MATKTLSASLDPKLYQRIKRTAREDGRKQSALVAEALSLYTALPADLRQLLRDLAPSQTPELAAALAARLRAAVLELRWERFLARLRSEGDPAVLERFDAMTAEELDTLAEEAVHASRSDPP